MARQKPGYINDVDELIERASVDQVLLHYGKPVPEKASGEHRMPCVFDESCSESQYGNLTVRLDDAARRIYCHSCGVRGNLLTLIHGLEHKKPPTGGRLRGEEFKDAVNKLQEINGQRTNIGSDDIPPERKTSAPDSTTPRATNVPMIRHEKEAARVLADLHTELIVDVGEMSPDAATYVRKRSWMTPELLREWGVGWIPGNGRSLFRKTYLAYTHRNERGEVISYSGRDLNFESKWQKWLRDGKPEEKKPNKHRYVSGYHKGLELYGGQAKRLEEPYVSESLKRRGVVVVEGMNEVLRMETLGVAAVGLGSNKATQTQLESLVRFARQAGDNRIVLLPDCDKEGEAGFRELLWKLAELQVDVRLGCSSQMFGGKFSGRQPEEFTDEEWSEIDHSLQRRHDAA